MGGDGGSIPHRSELVKEHKEKQRAENLTFGTSRLLRWTHCTLSGEILSTPICIDNLGNLYNKISLIESILNKTLPQQLSSYIKKIKYDIVDCKITIRSNIQNIKINNQKNGGIFMCPISNLVGNGRYPFVCLRKCGCIISQRALNNVNGDNCLICGIELDKNVNDYTRIPINPSKEKQQQLFKEIMKKKIKKKKKKNKKKDKNNNNDNQIQFNNDKEEKKDDNNNVNKLTKKDKKRKKKQIQNILEKEKKKNRLSGHKRVLDAAEESVRKKLKTSNVFASIFDRKQRDFNFAGGGKGF